MADKYVTKLDAGETIVISDGEYSDYTIAGCFVTCKPFTVISAVEAYKEVGGGTTLSQFVEFLVREGYLKPTKVYEWQVDTDYRTPVPDAFVEPLGWFNK